MMLPIISPCSPGRPRACLATRALGSSHDELAGQLQPAAALEDDVEHDSEGSHRENRERVTQSPAEFGHVLEVHAIDGAYQGRREEDGGPGRDALDILVLVEARLGQPFDLIVLALTDQGGVDGQRVLKQGAEAVDAFDDPQDVVADVAEVTLQFDVDVVLIEPGAEARR